MKKTCIQQGRYDVDAFALFRHAGDICQPSEIVLRCMTGADYEHVIDLRRGREGAIQRGDAATLRLDEYPITHGVSAGEKLREPL